MIQNVIVLGGGSAGFIAAIALKRKIPALRVHVIRSPDIGIIGVGEGTTRIFPKFFFEQLGLNPANFYALAQPTWNLGIRFLWGPRPHFHYAFSKTLSERMAGQYRLLHGAGFFQCRHVVCADGAGPGPVAHPGRAAVVSQSQRPGLPRGEQEAGLDFTGLSNQIVTFARGETFQRIQIPILGDTLVETHESFSLQISGPSGAGSLTVGWMNIANIIIRGKNVAL